MQIKYAYYQKAWKKFGAVTLAMYAKKCERYH